MELSLFLPVLLSIVSFAVAQFSGNELIISTSTGSYVGLINGTAPDVRQFLNIPYSQQPTGQRRWLPPAPPLTNSSIKLDATNFPPSCAQYLGSHPSVYNQDVPEFIIDTSPYPHAAGAMPPSSSESCLSLAIWAPTGNVTSLPVIIFMTGGGFNNGGIAIPYQLPHHWVQRTGAHIVVTINYRVGIMGFPNAGGLSSQNLGILDQRLALMWVRDNIEAFGGDPTKITLWGQSAGAASVDVHNFAFYQDVIVRGLFMESGTAYLLDNPRDTQHTNFSFVADKLGCPTSNATIELSCMRNIPATKIVNFIGRYNDGNNGSLPSLTFGPVPDGKIVFSNYTARYEQGLFSKIPAIIGNAADEGAGLTTYPANNRTAGPYQAAANKITLGSFICSSHNTSILRRQQGAITYRYQYAGNFTNISPRGWMGAYHDSDLPVLFGTYADFRDELMTQQQLSLEREVSERMQDYVLAFMRDPVGGPGNVGWQRFGSGEMLRWAGEAGMVVRNVSVGVVEGVCYGQGTYDPGP